MIADVVRVWDEEANFKGERLVPGQLAASKNGDNYNIVGREPSGKYVKFEGVSNNTMLTTATSNSNSSLDHPAPDYVMSDFPVHVSDGSFYGARLIPLYKLHYFQNIDSQLTAVDDYVYPNQSVDSAASGNYGRGGSIFSVCTGSPLLNNSNNSFGMIMRGHYSDSLPQGWSGHWVVHSELRTGTGIQTLPFSLWRGLSNPSGYQKYDICWLFNDGTGRYNVFQCKNAVISNTPPDQDTTNWEQICTEVWSLVPQLSHLVCLMNHHGLDTPLWGSPLDRNREFPEPMRRIECIGVSESYSLPTFNPENNSWVWGESRRGHLYFCAQAMGVDKVSDYIPLQESIFDIAKRGVYRYDNNYPIEGVWGEGVGAIVYSPQHFLSPVVENINETSPKLRTIPLDASVNTYGESVVALKSTSFYLNSLSVASANPEHIN